MAVQLDHTIVKAHDRHESATFLTEMFALQAPVVDEPFLAVEIANGLNLDFETIDGEVVPQHYAFRVSDAEFDAIFGRIRERSLTYWADPHKRQPGEIRHRGRSRSFYFEDPSKHLLEVLTPDEA